MSVQLAPRIPNAPFLIQAPPPLNAFFLSCSQRTVMVSLIFGRQPVGVFPVFFFPLSDRLLCFFLLLAPTEWYT